MKIAYLICNSAEPHVRNAFTAELASIGISVISPNILNNKEFREAQIALSDMTITCGEWKSDPICRDDFQYASNSAKEIFIGENHKTIIPLIQTLHNHAN